MNGFIMVYVTTSSKAEAEKIAQSLLNEHLIACANILGPVSSHFHWKNKIDSAEEFLMIMKSRVDLFLALERRVRALHSYEVPEVIAVPIADGSKGYLDWMTGVPNH
ncbi:MAG: divalent-cation tolerance protein CutA [Candidatus Bathyarchaeia archaeon]|jgi:periplasmic divalent cation tolerance protein